MLSTASPKPAKGSVLIARKERQKAIRAHEDAEKRKVRARDVRCRWPACPNCAAYKPRLEVAHLADKGMGGDHGRRSTADQMMLLCFLTHQGPHSLHAQTRRIEPLTSRGADGPCRFWELREEGWTVVHVEDDRA
jgi:hypothetical protein